MDSFSNVFLPRLANFMKSIITAFSISALCRVMRLTDYLSTAAEGAGVCEGECVSAYPKVLVDVFLRLKREGKLAGLRG